MNMRQLYPQAAQWTTSLPEIEGKRPWTFNRVKLITVDDLFRLFLRHGVWFARDLHGLHPIDIVTSQGNCNSAVAERLLNFGHVNGAIIFSPWLGSNRIHSNGDIGQISIGWNIEEGQGIAALTRLPIGWVLNAQHRGSKVGY